MNKFYLILGSVLIFPVYLYAFTIFDDKDGSQNIGRVPLITKWEREHLQTQNGPLSPEFQSLLNKTQEFKQKGKFEKTEKIYQRLLQESTHPQVLLSYGNFIEQTKEEFVTALHYYIYSIHESSNLIKLPKQLSFSYYSTLPIVQEYDKQLFQFLENEISFFSFIDLEQENSLEIIEKVQKQKRIEHIYHSNAIEGNKLSIEIVSHIISTGLPPNDGKSYHKFSVNEILGSLEAFDFSSYIALMAYQNLLEIENNVILEINAHQSLLSVPSVVWDNDNCDDFDYNHTNILDLDHIMFILKIHKMILGNVMPEFAG